MAQFFLTKLFCIKCSVELTLLANSCVQSYKASMIVIYDSRVVLDWKIPRITTLES